MQPMKAKEGLWKLFNPHRLLADLKAIATILPQSMKMSGF